MIIPFQFKVDSCRLSIPLKYCKILDENLLDHFQDTRTNLTTGETEIIKELKGVPFVKTFDDGISVKFWIENQFTYLENKARVSEQYITFLANSKHLKKRYFEGITLNTIKAHYDFIMSIKVFQCSLDSYLKARYTDIDICMDFKANLKGLETIKDNIKKNCLNTAHWHSANAKTSKNNSGIWSPVKNKPRENSTPRLPFIKAYSKDEDFKYKSTKFSNRYFKPEEYKDICRFEFTILNGKQKKALGITQPTFEEFLKTDFKAYCQIMYRRYFVKARMIKVSDKLKPMDRVIVDMMNDLIKEGKTRTDILKYFDRDDVNPMARRRLIEKYQELYSKELILKEKLDNNELSRSVFEILGVDISQQKLDL